MKPLKGQVAVVAGATRGAGRGIAVSLGALGATVYCTGRSTQRGRKTARGDGGPFVLEQRKETLEQTAQRVTAAGGVGIPVRVDHTVEREVKKLFARVHKEQGRLDVLVNDVWGGDALAEWGTPFWEQSLDKGLLMLQRAVHSHIITSRYAVPLMVARRRGVIVEITDGERFNYRGTFFYDLVKMSVLRLAFSMSQELRGQGVASVAVTPGFLRSEAMLEHMGVTEETWREGARKDRHFLQSETPFYVGQGVARLVADRSILKKTGRVFTSAQLARVYKFKDQDGRRPDFPRYLATSLDKELVKLRQEMATSHAAYAGMSGRQVPHPSTP